MMSEKTVLACLDAIPEAQRLVLLSFVDEVRQLVDEEFALTLGVVRLLRDANHGCPWDLKQTAYSLRSSLVEEAYECVEAISEGNHTHIAEELGDVLMIVLLISVVEEQSGGQPTSLVFRELVKKMIRRHPHIFGLETADSVADVLKSWQRIKSEIEGRESIPVLFEKTSEQDLSALDRAAKVQKDARKFGFDWFGDTLDGPLAKVAEESAEVAEAMRDGDVEAIETEIGDLLFAAVNVARRAGVDPTIALARATRKFTTRFGRIADRMAAAGTPLTPVDAITVDRLDGLSAMWEAVKSEDQNL